MPTPALSLPEGILVRTSEPRAEVAWFAALCSDDYQYLGVPDGGLRSSFAHCRDIALAADRLGYDNILLPSSWQVGQDPLVFAAGIAREISQMSLLVAIRSGEIHPPMLARALASLDHMLEGRLTLNVISSDLPGATLDSAARYRRSGEVIAILRQAWSQGRIDHDGEFWQLQLETTEPAQSWQPHGGPLLYFGGYSEPARVLCARHCDVYLMWPDTEAGLLATMRDLGGRAARHGRTLDFGLRIHVIVRETESEARAAADRLVSRLDDARGTEIKHRAQDARSAGVLRQDQLRDAAHTDWIEDHVWSGIGRARSGCGSAIVGDPDQVLAKLTRYVDMGIRAFILSGYPHLDECRRFADLVLPRLDTMSLPRAQGRRPESPPVTPLTTAPRR
jgi:alkanesulfonate monooxygenase